MQAASQAFVYLKAGIFPAFDRLFECYFLLLFGLISATPSVVAADKEFSLLDLEELVETCIEQTDLDIEHRSALPIRTDNPRFSEVRLSDAGKFEEVTKLGIADYGIENVFEPDASEKFLQETLNGIRGILQHEPAVQRHRELVLRRIGAHALWKSPVAADGEWNSFGMPRGSAWWYAQDVAVVWRSGGFSPIGFACQIYNVPPQAARKFVEDSNWRFKKETRGPISRYVATQNAIAPTPRILVRILTAIGRTHSLPSARIEVIEIEPGFLTEDHPGEWLIVVSDSRYHDFL